MKRSPVVRTLLGLLKASWPSLLAHTLPPAAPSTASFTALGGLRPKFSSFAKHLQPTACRLPRSSVLQLRASAR
ncbi:hypothetical protein B0H21DRAFT_34424 [Amylocystis lapponica]|nr:hypothetical protein B0H21DRAFT_34424 [Amylocystis lapponica]